MYPHYQEGPGAFHWLLFVFLVLLVAGLAWFLVSLALGRFTPQRAGGSAVMTTPTALETLDLRYARGEIGRDEYLQTRADLGSPPSSV